MKGHGRKTKSGLRSTKAYADSEPDLDDVENATMNQTHSLTKQKESILMVFDLSDEAQRLMYTDQTGKIQVQPIRGKTSLMVYHDVDANYIDAEPLRNYMYSQMISAYQNLWALTNCGRKTKQKLHILDNKASKAFKSAIKENCEL